MPCVQGHLRPERVAITIQSECAHCAQPLRFEVDSDLDYRIAADAANPLIFIPMVDFAKLKDPHIIDAF